MVIAEQWSYKNVALIPDMKTLNEQSNISLGVNA